MPGRIALGVGFKGTAIEASGALFMKCKLVFTRDGQELAVVRIEWFFDHIQKSIQIDAPAEVQEQLSSMRGMCFSHAEEHSSWYAQKMKCNVEVETSGTVVFLQR